MFSPHEGGPATATRSRRRQRPVSSDSLAQQPKAKRQRLPLTEQTFVNPDVPPEMFQVKADKVAMLSARRDGVENHSTTHQNSNGSANSAAAAAAASASTPTTSASAPKKELSVRSKKTKAGERISKGDGSVVLVCFFRGLELQNPFYSFLCLISFLFMFLFFSFLSFLPLYHVLLLTPYRPAIMHTRSANCLRFPTDYGRTQEVSSNPYILNRAQDIN